MNARCDPGRLRPLGCPRPHASSLAPPPTKSPIRPPAPHRARCSLTVAGLEGRHAFAGPFARVRAISEGTIPLAPVAPSWVGCSRRDLVDPCTECSSGVFGTRLLDSEKRTCEGTFDFAESVVA